MDWKGFIDRFESMTCVLSVEKKPDGGYGTIRIVTGTQSYIDTIALAAGGVDLDSGKKEEFIPNSEYTRYIPKDLNFEDVCYRCAVLKEPIHNCLRASRYPFDILVYLAERYHLKTEDLMKPFVKGLLTELKDRDMF